MIPEALRHFKEGYRAQMEGRIDEAIERYKQSIAIEPSAEAHTFLGWAYSFQGQYEAAIAECRTAIRVDPDFGNPYNDIGAYLIELERLDEAIPWLDRAKGAKRYDPRHYPYVNLSRIYVKQGKLDEAAAELQAALALEVTHPDVVRVLPRLHLTLSQVHVRRGDLDAAIAELRAAIARDSEFLEAHRELHRLVGMLN